MLSKRVFSPVVTTNVESVMSVDWSFRILACLSFILIATQQAAGIKCWVCRSDADPRCVDPFDNTSIPITDCEVQTLVHHPGLKASMCRKIRQKVYGNWRFIRSCAFLGAPGEGTGNENYCTMRTGTYNVFVETCTCNSKDGCNTASVHSLSFPSLLLTTLLFFIEILFFNSIEVRNIS